MNFSASFTEEQSSLVVRTKYTRIHEQYQSIEY